MSDQNNENDDTQEFNVEEAEQYNSVPSDEESNQEEAPAENSSPDGQLEKIKNEYLYLRAEFDNYRKQAIKERSQATKYGAERLARDLLNVIDILETAVNSEVTPETLDNFRTGVEMTLKEFTQALQNNGIEAVPSEGVPFDPNIHEAMGSEETTDHTPGHVIRAFRKPYKYHDKLLRPGQVIVAMKPTSSSPPPPPSDGPNDSTPEDSNVYEIDIDED